MTEPRTTFVLKDWLQLLVAMATVTTLATTFVAWAFTQWSDWRDVPERMIAMEARLATLPGAVAPQLVEFLGRGVVPHAKVAAGQRVAITYVLRRTVSCETTVRVRFFDFSTNTVLPGYEVTAIKSAVANTFSDFTVSVLIPKDLPPGLYSYFPEFIPLECGVYGAIVPPMSDPFVVTQ